MSALTDSINNQNFNIRTAFLNRTLGHASRPPKITEEGKCATACRRRIEDYQMARELGVSLNELGAV
ncbi:hypothetical protein [Shewanella sp. MBTL60-007]|uniref:hypothetical protein n=1 Tax=Shewanella sp. MBTL60-007 TaxID=2815911 RepID=UPI001BBF53D4|nr:hypothetical protein [Shewanella sp. MBTL60-007]GIU13025.1 hypothetical protein TUM3792_02220 [Shewanella sp. MBTL60-007]